MKSILLKQTIFDIWKDLINKFITPANNIFLDQNNISIFRIKELQFVFEKKRDYIVGCLLMFKENISVKANCIEYYIL